MKQFLSFVRKEFHHIFRDHRTMLILLGMPVVEIILFGFALSTEVKNVKIIVVDPSGSTEAGQIVRRLDANDRFILTSGADTPARAEQMLQAGKADLAVIFSPSFGKDLYTAGGAEMQLLADATNPNNATAMTMYASSIVNDWLADQTRAPESVRGIVPSLRLLYNPRMESSYNFVPGIMGLILMLICAMMTSISIVREKETGTMEVLLVSPIKPLWIILAKMVPYFTLSCVNFTTILVLSVTLLGVPLAGSLFWLCAVSLLFLVVSLALGLLISTVTHTQVAAMLVSGMVLMMPVVMLSGMVFPVENMPGALQAISCALPARWYIEAVRKLMIEGLPFHYVWKETAILAGMALALIAVSLRKFNNRLE